MARKILTLIVSTLLIVSIAIVYLKFKKEKSPVNDPIAAVPQSAGLIFIANEASDLWSKIQNNNLIWQELLSTALFAKLNRDVHEIDSIAHSNKSISEFLNGNKLIISVHPKGAQDFDFLFTISIPVETEEADIIKAFASIDDKAIIGNRNFENSIIHSIKFSKAAKEILILVSSGLVSISQSPVIIEDVIKQINKPETLLSNPDFYKIYETAGSKVDGNLFVNYKQFPKLLGAFLNDEAKAKSDNLSYFGNWAALDLSVKTNSFMLNGFSVSNDSLNNYLNLFKNQTSQKFEFTRVIPSNVSCFLFLGFSNFENFHQNYLDKHFISKERTELEKEYKELGIELRKNLFDWVGNEIVSVITEPQGNDFTENVFAVFKSSSLERALSAIEEISDSVSSISGIEIKVEDYKDFKIKQALIKNALPLYMGSAFSGFENPFYLNIGRYIIYGNSVESLKRYIDLFVQEKTLIKDPNYISFSENLSEESNIYLYSNIARSPLIFENFIKENFAKDIEDNITLYRKFEGFAMQISSSGELFYNNIYFKHNPIYKEEISSLWEQKLDTTISLRPRIITNHTNNSKEIFVQDDANQIYLISNTGKIIWKKQLEEKIISDVFQVDVYKNKKLQILFNTASKIYLLDRNGNKVEKFPVSLPAEASAGISLFDYDNNKDYRIVVPCHDNKVHNYNPIGEPLKGWNFKKTESIISKPIQHVLVNNKDFLVSIDNSGKVHITDRRGEIRTNLKERIFISSNNDFYIERGKDLATTKIVATDSTGTVQKLSLTDELEKITLGDFSKEHFFDFKDLNNDRIKEYIFADNQKLEVIDQGKNLSFSYELDNPFNIAPIFFLFPDNSGKIGLTDHVGENIFVLDEFGNLLNNTPLKGRTSFSINDINKDGNLVLIAGSDKSIYAYPLK